MTHIPVRRGLLASLLFLSFIANNSWASEQLPLSREENISDLFITSRHIGTITVEGNKLTPTAAITNCCIFKSGDIFDPRLTRKAILHLYRELRRFRNIQIFGKNVGENTVDLYIVVEEKPILKKTVIQGNKAVSEADIHKAIQLENVPAIDQQELKTYAEKIKKPYFDKGYINVDIAPSLQIEDGRAVATFTITEGEPSLVKEITFIGNNHISDKELRAALFTREDWILSFVDKSGKYHPERLSADQYQIEQLYQNRGYLYAKVIDIKAVPRFADNHELKLVFDIEEGDQYTISSVNAPGNDILPEEFLLAMIPIRPGMHFSRDLVTKAVKNLERVWGDRGYLFAHVNYSMQPDDEAKTVALTFISEPNNVMTLGRINIIGNEKTRNKVILRKLALTEGEPLNRTLMDISKANVESLGYFEPRDGVTWHTRRVNSTTADLDLILKEGRTGNFILQAGFGGLTSNKSADATKDTSNPASGLNIQIGASDTNLLGYGIDAKIEANLAKSQKSMIIHFAQPWLFDKPISGAIDIYHKRPSYESLRNVNQSTINEHLWGGALSAGFITQSNWYLMSDTQLLMSIGFDRIGYEKKPEASFFGAPDKAKTEYQGLLDRLFSRGNFLWFAANLEQNKVNHPMHPSRGYQWRWSSKAAAPVGHSNISFYKTSLDVNWFTPLIEEYGLTLRLHGHVGLLGPIKEKDIPFGELYHIGGPSSVRGFLFGQVSPRFLGDSIGAKKAFFWSAELIFPFTADMSMKGALFYDGGAGFDTPYRHTLSPEFVTNNNFDYRHSIGFGIRILNPAPIRIDWAFKIDPRQNKANPERSESSHEVHFGMTYGW